MVSYTSVLSGIHYHQIMVRGTNHMWHDDDGLLRVVNDVFSAKGATFPYECPTCKNASLHMFLFRSFPDTGFGGLWIWCSSCFSKVHTSFKVPCWWTNTEEIQIDELSTQVSYLESRKAVIDQFVNDQFSTYKSADREERENGRGK